MALRDLVFYLHIASLGLAGSGVLYADHLGFSWLRGKSELLLRQHLMRAHYVVSTALVLLIGSGFYMFWPMRAYLLHQPLFLLKMGFVAALIVNAVVIGELMHVATHTPFSNLPRRNRIPLFISGAVSMLCWAGAGVSALLLF